MKGLIAIFALWLAMSAASLGFFATLDTGIAKAVYMLVGITIGGTVLCLFTEIINNRRDGIGTPLKVHFLGILGLTIQIVTATIFVFYYTFLHGYWG